MSERDMSAFPSVSLVVPTSSAPCRLVGLGGYSIRLADEFDTPCAICTELTGSGPVGYFEDAPICDRCLDEGCRDLGMILALITAARIHDSLARQSPHKQAAHLETLSDFIASFGRFAARWGPVRVVKVGSGEDDEAPS